MRQLIAGLLLTTQRCFPDPSCWLTPAEIGVFERIRAPQRRQDWLAGRWAAKELIRTYFHGEAGRELALGHIEILNDESGAPYARVPCAPRHVEISLAHSAGYGLAGLSPHGPVGVDLQRIRSVRSDLGERVLAENELKSLARCFPEHLAVEGFCVFWALKEAAIKAQRVRPAPALREIIVQLCQPGQAAILLRDRKLRAQWGRVKEFVWAVAWSEEYSASQFDDRDAVAALMGWGGLKALHEGQSRQVLSDLTAQDPHPLAMHDIPPRQSCQH